MGNKSRMLAGATALTILLTGCGSATDGLATESPATVGASNGADQTAPEAIALATDELQGSAIPLTEAPPKSSSTSTTAAPTTTAALTTTSVTSTTEAPTTTTETTTTETTTTTTTTEAPTTTSTTEAPATTTTTTTTEAPETTTEAPGQAPLTRFVHTFPSTGWSSMEYGHHNRPVIDAILSDLNSLGEQWASDTVEIVETELVVGDVTFVSSYSALMERANDPSLVSVVYEQTLIVNGSEVESSMERKYFDTNCGVVGVFADGTPNIQCSLE